jgi:hypothetical protein
MKMMGILIVVFMGIPAYCSTIGDPVSSVIKENNKEITTFKRDGKTILVVRVLKLEDPKKQILTQQVVFNDHVLLDICDMHGKRAFNFRSYKKMVVGFQQNAKTGNLESVSLMDESNHFMEIFDVKNSRLIPLSGKELQRQREMIKDMSDLLSPDNMKKTTPEKFEKQARDLIEKYQTQESGR